jgi:hypothetical protein
MPKQRDMFYEADKLAMAGMNAAADKAEQDKPGWRQKVWELYIQYVRSLDFETRFFLEDFRAWVAGKIDEPQDLHSCAHLSVKGQSAGLIKKAGYGKTRNKKAHGAPCSMWVRAK